MRTATPKVERWGQPAPRLLFRNAGWRWGRALLPGWMVLLAVQATAGPLQLCSVPGSTFSPPAGGGGDSGAPLISPDGRYVLFASTANNLLLLSNSLPLPLRLPACLNVFVRDRSSNTTALVSVNLSGTGGGNADSLPLGLSADGRYALFESSASDLVPGDTNNATDIFVRDLLRGTTLLVSASTNGSSGDGASRSATMTPDGRWVGFVSAADNLVPGDTNGIPDVFVRDLQLGRTSLVSAGASPWSGKGLSDAPEITPDGHYVAFYNIATNLVPGAINAGDIYVRDLAGGTTVRASTDAGAAVQSLLNSAAASCYNHAISADGRFVVYEASSATAKSTSPGLILRYNLETASTEVLHTNAATQVPSREDLPTLDMTPDGQRVVFVANTNCTDGTTTCVLLWDAVSGATTLLSGDLDGLAPTNSTCDWPAIDPTGQLVVFGSSAPHLTTNALVGACHLYLRDLQAGVTTLLDTDASGAGSPISPAALPQLSANGRFVAFESADASLVADDHNRNTDVFVRDLVHGTVELVSPRHPTLASLSANGPSLLSPHGLSADARYLAFASEAGNLVPNDTNGCRDVFIRDQLNGMNLLVSAAPTGQSGNGVSWEPALSADGRYVAFTSRADDLVAGDTNQASDVFVRDLQTGTTVRVSVDTSGSGCGNKDSDSPFISSDGRYVLFRSQASNLAPGSFSGINLFMRDLQSAVTYALSFGGGYYPAMTPDGSWVAFADAGVNKLCLWSVASKSRVYTTNTASLSATGVSPDGSKLVFWAGSLLFLVDRTANTSGALTSGYPAPNAGLRFAPDGRLLVYSARSNYLGADQVFVYDFQAQSNFLVSRSCNTAAPANGSSDAPDLSADGRFVAYRSAATDLVPGDTNGVPDLFLYDRQTGVTTLLSVSQFGNYAADNRSSLPVFSPDGQTLVFQTCASDLVSGDFNHSTDIVAQTLYASGSIPVFSAAVVAPSGAGQGPWITWPAVPGKSYRVLFKNSLDAPDWQDLGGLITIIGNQAWCRDLAPAASQRFYRIQAF